MSNKVWFVTGGSKGLGLHLVRALAAQGAQVAVTSRNPAPLMEEFGHNVLALEVDLVDEASVQRAVQATVARFGRVDVLVNNAGFGQIGALEEVSDLDARRSFDINVFGVLNVLRAALPQLRSQRSGTIFNIASVAGFVGGFPGFGVYCATKFALAGLTESLQAEVAELGIQVSLVYPGYFRTEFLSPGSLVTVSNKIGDYRNVHGNEDRHLKQIHHNQPGDPRRFAAALLQAAESSPPPGHLFLGSDALAMASEKVSWIKAALEQHKALSISTDFAHGNS